MSALALRRHSFPNLMIDPIPPLSFSSYKRNKQLAYSLIKLVWAGTKDITFDLDLRKFTANSFTVEFQVYGATESPLVKLRYMVCGN